MKIDVGMYVRTEYGISKIVNIFFEKTGTFIETDNGLGNCNMSTKGIYILEEDYKTFIDNNVKNNIIDLIEPMDLMFIDISPDDCGGIVVPRIAETLDELERWKEHIFNGYWILKGIVTREQIEYTIYKVSE